MLVNYVERDLMEKKIVLLDSDGVIADILERWLDVYNNTYNDSLTREEFASTFGGLHNVVKPECGEKVYDILREPGFDFEWRGTDHCLAQRGSAKRTGKDRRDHQHRRGCDNEAGNGRSASKQ